MALAKEPLPAVVRDDRDRTNILATKDRIFFICCCSTQHLFFAMVITAATAATTAAPSQGSQDVTDDTSSSTPAPAVLDHPPVMVWVTQGKTDHAAYILKEQHGRKLVKWAANQATEWVDADVEIKTELPKRRRGRRPSHAYDADYVFSSSVVVSKPPSHNATATSATASSAAAAVGGTSKKRTRSSQGPKAKANKGGKRVAKYPKGTKVSKVRTILS